MKYPLAHATEFAGLELVASRFLKAKHDKLALKVDNLFVNLFGGHLSNFLQFLRPFRHHHHWHRSAAFRGWNGACGRATELNAIEWLWEKGNG